MEEKKKLRFYMEMNQKYWIWKRNNNRITMNSNIFLFSSTVDVNIFRSLFSLRYELFWSIFLTIFCYYAVAVYHFYITTINDNMIIIINNNSNNTCNMLLPSSYCCYYITWLYLLLSSSPSSSHLQNQYGWWSLILMLIFWASSSFMFNWLN